MLSPFSPNPFPLLPCFHEGAPSPNHPLPLQHLGISLHWENAPSLNQRPLLPVMPDNAILCYIYNWSHGSLCVLNGWCFSPWEFWRVWLVDNVVPPIGLQTLTAPSVLSLAPSLGSTCLVRWLAASIINCICMTLAEPLRRHPYLAPASKYYLASAIVLGFGGYIWIPR